MSRNAVIAVVGVVVLVLVGWFLTRPKQTTSPELSQPTQAPVSTESAVFSANTVNITDSGFSPKEIIIKAGGSVTWENQDSVGHTVNSAVHPTHLVYPPLNLDVIKPGEQKSLAFPAVGTYKYHDHLNPSLTGSVTVQ